MAEQVEELLGPTPNLSLMLRIYSDGKITGEVIEQDGTTIAKFIAANARKFQQTRFIVHSLNEPGARRMERIIRDAGLTVIRQPFAWQHIRFS